MIELVDWIEIEQRDPGTPGWYTLAIEITGETRRPAHVFVAFEHPPDGTLCRVLLAADIPDHGPEVMTRFKVTVHETFNGVAEFVLAGASRSTTIHALTPRGATQAGQNGE